VNLFNKATRYQPTQLDIEPGAYFLPVSATLCDWVADGSLRHEDLAAFNRGELNLGQLVEHRSRSVS
jgi:hypothetical protein